MTAFIFDLDGTLNDSIPLIVATSKLAYKELGADISEERIKSMIGVPLVETGEEILGPGRGQAYLEAYLRHYNTLDYPMRAFPGIAEMLADLRAHGAKLALATAKRRQMAHDTLDAIGLSDALDAIVDSESTERRKPFPDPALKALELLGVTAEESVFVGDSSHDILCGHSAGLRTVAVTWGAGTADELISAQPDYTVHTVAELRELLLSFI